MPRKVSWTVLATYDGFDATMDRRLNSAVGKLCDSSGCGFGERDLEWDFHMRQTAQDAIERIRAAKIRGVKIQLISDSGD